MPASETTSHVAPAVDQRRTHWTETAERTYDGSWPFIGPISEDEHGDLRVPSFRRRNWWAARLDLRKPWHWPSYLRSRLSGRIVMIELAYGGES